MKAKFFEGWPYAVRHRVALAVLLCQTLAASAFGAALERAVVSQTDTHTSLTGQAYWYQEPAVAHLDVEAVRERLAAGAFERSRGDWLELGIMDAVVWVALELENQTGEDKLYLQLRNPRMSYVDLYLPDGEGGYTVMENGSARSYAARDIVHPMPTFPVAVAPGERRLVLFRLENIGDMRIRIWSWGGDGFISHISEANHLEMMTTGGLFVLAVFHLLVFLSLRQMPYLYLSLFILTWLLFLLAGSGIGAPLLWGEWNWLSLRVHSLVAVLMNITFLLFTLSFLDTRRTLPGWHRAGLGLVGLCVLHFVYCCLADHLLRVVFGQYLTLTTVLFVSAVVVAGCLKGNRKAYYFMATWVFLFIGSLIILLVMWYVVSAAFFITVPLVNVLFATSILLWSFEITGQLKVQVARQRQELEEQVQERTRDLEQALREVKTLSGLLPICSHCKKIRDDSGYWNSVEQYLHTHTDAAFSHGICPDCVTTHYPDFAEKVRDREKNG